MNMKKFLGSIFSEQFMGQLHPPKGGCLSKG